MCARSRAHATNVYDKFIYIYICPYAIRKIIYLTKKGRRDFALWGSWESIEASGEREVERERERARKIEKGKERNGEGIVLYLLFETNEKKEKNNNNRSVLDRVL